MKKNIVLIGMMGSGKSTIAKLLEKRLRLKRYSTDEIIEAKTKKSITELVASKGWDYFRLKEERVVAQLSKKKGVIIDTGGGVILNPANLKALKNNGIVFFVKASPASIYKRIKNEKHRPLLQVPNPLGEIRRIYKERLPLYSRADVVIHASTASFDKAIAKIRKAVNISLS